MEKEDWRFDVCLYVYWVGTSTSSLLPYLFPRSRYKPQESHLLNQFLPPSICFGPTQFLMMLHNLMSLSCLVSLLGWTLDKYKCQAPASLSGFIFHLSSFRTLWLFYPSPWSLNTWRISGSSTCVHAILLCETLSIHTFCLSLLFISKISAKHNF